MNLNGEEVSGTGAHELIKRNLISKHKEAAQDTNLR
jgi:hypothetical protein